MAERHLYSRYKNCSGFSEQKACFSSRCAAARVPFSRPHNIAHHLVFVVLGDPARAVPAEASHLPDAVVPSAATPLRSGPVLGML